MLFFKKKFQPFNLFVSIAAGNNQLPLIKAAKKLGFSIISIDRNADAPGFPLSDIRIQESIESREEIYTKLCELLIDGNINGILSRSYGEAIETAAYLNEKLKIPYLPLESVQNLNNKKKMKTILKQNDISTAGFTQYSTRRKKPYDYPVIIKPISGHAKNGVRLISDKSSLDKYLKVFSTQFKSFLIEEFIEGDEIIAFGIVKSGKFSLIEITDKITTEKPHFADILHASPSMYWEDYETITNEAQKIVDAFSIISSPLVVEFKIKDGEYYVIEAVPEFGGEFIPEFLIPSTQSINIFEQAILAISGRPLTFGQFKKARNHTVIKYITGKKGSLKSFKELKLTKHDLIAHKMFKKSGDVTSPATSNHDRLGFVVATARSREAAIAKCDAAIEELQIQFS
jgi:biotin carboxylase